MLPGGFFHGQIWPFWPYFELSGHEEKFWLSGLFQENLAFSGLFRENLGLLAFSLKDKNAPKNLQPEILMKNIFDWVSKTFGNKNAIKRPKK